MLLKDKNDKITTEFMKVLKTNGVLKDKKIVSKLVDSLL